MIPPWFGLLKSLNYYQAPGLLVDDMYCISVTEDGKIYVMIYGLRSASLSIICVCANSVSFAISTL